MMKHFLSSALMMMLLLAAPGISQMVPFATQVIPVFPDGVTPDGVTHTTKLVVQNPNLFSNVNCSITFFGAVPMVRTPDGRTIHSTVIQQFLPPGGFNILSSTASSSLSSGFAKLNCSEPVAAYSMYSVHAAGEGAPALISETSMPAAFAATGFQFINDSRQGGRLAVAFANEASIGATVLVTIGDLLGRTIVNTSFIVPRFATLAKFLDEIAPSLPPNHVGPVLFRSALPVYAAGLRFNGASVTSISPAAQLQ